MTSAYVYMNVQIHYLFHLNIFFNILNIPFLYSKTKTELLSICPWEKMDFRRQTYPTCILATMETNKYIKIITYWINTCIIHRIWWYIYILVTDYFAFIFEMHFTMLKNLLIRLSLHIICVKIYNMTSHRQARSVSCLYWTLLDVFDYKVARRILM